MSSLLRLLLPPTPPASTSVYLVPHQDDEVSALGAAILAEVAAGVDVVAFLTTRGQASMARTHPTMVARLGYTPSFEEFSAARDREFVESCTRMGATPVVLPYEQRQPDGGSVTSVLVDQVKALFPPTVALRGHSRTEVAVDHGATGEAVEELAAQGWGTDHRQFIHALRAFTTLWPAGVTRHKMGALGAPNDFHFWPYKHVDVPAGWWGIGYLSAPAYFDYLSDVDSASYWHGLLD